MRFDMQWLRLCMRVDMKVVAVAVMNFINCMVHGYDFSEKLRLLIMTEIFIFTLIAKHIA